jgi:hypothetical protein
MTKRESNTKAAHEMLFLAARNVCCRLQSRAVDDPLPASPTPDQPKTVQLKTARPEFLTRSLIAMVNEDLIFDQRLF